MIWVFFCNRSRHGNITTPLHFLFVIVKKEPNFWPEVACESIRFSFRRLLSYNQCLQLTGPVYKAMPLEETFHDDYSVKTKTTRQHLARIWMYMQSNVKQSQNQAERLKKLSDVKRKVNFRSSQVEAFINRKVSNQYVIIINTNIFILNRKNLGAMVKILENWKLKI